MSTAVATDSLGKRYGTEWALSGCTVEIPEGRICGLVGSNGAGKTTLLRLLAGLAKPSTGQVKIFDRAPADDVEFLRSVGFLAQEIPLYKRWNTEDHLAMGKHLNRTWNEQITRDRIRSLGIALDQRVGTLSGGQRAQVALAMALGKRPRLLLLDEPVAALDPLARRDFLSVLAEAVADGDLTVILSSHLVGDLERVCDRLVLLDNGEVRLSADLDEVVAEHRLLSAPRDGASLAALERAHTVLRVETTPRQTTAWVRLRGPLHDPGWQVDALGLEDIVLAHMGRRERRPEPVLAGVSEKVVAR